MINNTDIYLDRMSKSMVDKVFFIDKINLSEVDVLVDFGCGSGDLGLNLKEILYKNGIEYIGYDNNLTLSANSKMHITSNWEDIMAATQGKKSILVMSSVVHELIHYLSYEELTEVVDMISNVNFEYIVIRDMYLDSSINNDNESEWLNANFDIVKKHLSKEQIKYFESRPFTNKTLMDIFFKFKYKENADRELHEEYWYDINLVINQLDEYEIELETYSLDYTSNLIEDTFDYILNGDSHYKLIARLK